MQNKPCNFPQLIEFVAEQDWPNPNSHFLSLFATNPSSHWHFDGRPAGHEEWSTQVDSQDGLASEDSTEM